MFRRFNFPPVSASVGAAIATQPSRSAHSEAAVADYIGMWRAREIVVRVLERRLGDVGKHLVRKKRPQHGISMRTMSVES